MSFVFVRIYCPSFLRRGWSCGFDFCIETSVESHVVTQKMTCYDLIYACLVFRCDLGHDGLQRVKSFYFECLENGAFVAGDSSNEKQTVCPSSTKSAI